MQIMYVKDRSFSAPNDLDHEEGDQICLVLACKTESRKTGKTTAVSRGHTGEDPQPPPSPSTRVRDPTQPLPKRVCVVYELVFFVRVLCVGVGFVRWFVFHLAVLDSMSSCNCLSVCLEEIKAWSDVHLAHHILFIEIELKVYGDFLRVRFAHT